MEPSGRRLHRADAVAAVAPEADLAVGTGEEQLARRDLWQQLVSGRAAAVAHDGRHLDVVHGQDEAARGTVLGEGGDHRRRGVHGGTGPAPVGGNERAEQPGTAQLADGLGGEAGFAVDVVGSRAGDLLADPFRHLHQVKLVYSVKPAHLASLRDVRPKPRGCGKRVGCRSGVQTRFLTMRDGLSPAPIRCHSPRWRTAFPWTPERGLPPGP